MLSRPATQISLRQILLTLEGQTTPIDQILSLPCTIDVGPEHCAIREVLLEVKEAVDRILSSISLADMASRQMEILDRDIRIPLDVPDRKPSPLVVLPE